MDPVLPGDPGAGDRGGVALLRRAMWRGRHGPWRQPAAEDDSLIAVLGHRFATGEIDEEECWRRLSVLDERFGHSAKGRRV